MSILSEVKPEPQPKRKKTNSPIARYAPAILILALVLVGAATGLSELLRDFFDPTNLVMIYLLSTVMAAVYLGLGPSILVSVLGVLIFDFLFIPPYLSFAVADIRFFFSLISSLWQ